MKVSNKTRQTTIAEDIIIPSTLLDQSLGLLRHPSPTAMLLKTRWGIHTFGMRYPIDIVILDKDNQVAAIKENLKPNRIFLWNPGYETVLELPFGTTKKTKTKLTDEITFYK